MNWTIYTYGNGEFLQMIFNGIAMMFGGNDYLMAMNIAGLLGFTAVLIKAAFDRESIANFKWLIVMFVLYLALIVPKSNVIISDSHNVANNSVVANVPLGLAMTAGGLSHFFDWLTRSFETVFTLSNNTNYSSRGALGGHAMVDRVMNIRIPEERAAVNFTEFFNSCVIIDGVGNKRFTWEQVLRSSDLGTFFQNNVAQNAAFFAYTNAANATNVLPCRSGYTNSLYPDLLATTNQALQVASIDLISFTGSLANATAALNSDMQDVINTMTGVNQTPAQHAMQSMQVNAIGDSLNKIAAQVNANEFIGNYVSSKAEAERSESYRAMASLATVKLPMLKNLFEAFIYAVFPLIALMSIVAPQKVPLAYAKTLLWISMWSPLFAILHFAFTYHGQDNLTQTLLLYANGFSVLSLSEITPRLSESAETAGYLFISIPLISWLFVSQSGALLSATAGRVLQGYDSSVGHASQESVSGKGSLGGTEFQTTDSGGALISNYDSYGNHHTNTEMGQVTQFAGTSANNVKMNVSEEVGQGISSSLNDSHQIQQSQSSEMANTNSTVLSNAQGVFDKATESESFSMTESAGSVAQYETAYQNANQVLDNFERSNGVSLSDSGRAKVLAGGGVDIGVFKAAATGEAVTEAQEQDLHRKLEGAMSSDQFTTAAKEMAQASFSLGSNAQSGVDSSSLTSLQASIDSQFKEDQKLSVTESNVAAFSQLKQEYDNASSSLAFGSLDTIRNYTENRGDFTDEQITSLISRANNGDVNSQNDLQGIVDSHFENRMNSIGVSDQTDSMIDQNISFGDLPKPQNLNEINEINTLFSDALVGRGPGIDETRADIDNKSNKIHETNSSLRDSVSDTKSTATENIKQKQDDIETDVEVARQKDAVDQVIGGFKSALDIR
ncbi:MAG: conjugal transfer protein TraG N-terminal domain-containing protein [Methylococcales bacterium]